MDATGDLALHGQQAPIVVFNIRQDGNIGGHPGETIGSSFRSEAHDGQAVIEQREKKMSATLRTRGTSWPPCRTGRASLSMFDGVMVDYYGTMTPLNQVAKLSVPILRWSWRSRSTHRRCPPSKRRSSRRTRAESGQRRQARPHPDSLADRRARKQLVKKVNGLGKTRRRRVRLLGASANDELKKLQKDGELAEDDARRATTTSRRRRTSTSPRSRRSARTRKRSDGGLAGP
jgi:ribosome recycling factor